MNRIFKLTLWIGGFILMTDTSNAQPGTSAPVSAGQKATLINSVCVHLKNMYVFPDKGEQVATLLQDRLKKGDYDNIATADAFSEAVTKDMQSISHDGHLNINYIPQMARQLQLSRKESEADRKMADSLFAVQERHRNFGFDKVERLSGNIGYLNLLGFATMTPEAGQVAAGAMAFLANSDAIIIDLQQNGGGDPTMIQFLTSYFFDSKPVHLNDFYTRTGGEQLDQSWTLSYVPGKRLPHTPLFVLTSRFSFSAAEEFVYNLKNLKRATLVGETTGGGANNNELLPLDENFVLSISYGRAISPITKTNWEGVGVEPDVKTPQEMALITAQRLALEKLRETSSDTAELDWWLTDLRAREKRLTVAPDRLKKYVGMYRDREVTLENGVLYSTRRNLKRTLTPLSETLFAIEGGAPARLDFAADGREVTTLYLDGRRETTPRNK